MKYKTKIIAQGNGYIGHVILNEEIIHTSSFHKDTIMVVRELSQYIASNPNQQTTNPNQQFRSIKNTSNTSNDNRLPLRRTVEIFKSSESEANPQTQIEQVIPPASAPRKCCGRR